MKKWMNLLPAVAALFVSLPVFPQFVLTPQGFVNAADGTSDCYVIECPGAGQEELFRAVSYFLEVQMAGSRTMFHAAEPDSFSVNAFVRGAVADGARAFRSLYDMEFRMMFDIRDGQVCVRAPEVKAMRRVTFDEEAEPEAPMEPGLTVRIGHRPGKVEVARLFVSRSYVPVGASLYDGSGGDVIFNRRGKLKRKVAKASLEDYINGLTGALERHLCAEGGR